jgi:hypothetical protein
LKDMEVWQIVLYGVASLIALKSLTSLMTSYRERLLHQLAEKEEEERHEAEARAKAARAAEKRAGRTSAA